MRAPELWLFDRFDGRLGILPALGAVTHAEELGGEDSLDLECLAAPEKGERLVWRDPEDGAWREHVVVSTEEPMGAPVRVHAEASWCEMLGDFIESAQLMSKTSAQMMAAALAPTRWRLGEDAAAGWARRSCFLYRTNALAGLRRVAELWGLELAFSVGVDGGRVASRTVSLVSRVGADRGARLDHGHDLAGCERAVLPDEVFTALYGYGKGLPITDEDGAHTGGYTRRLTFGEVNGGVNWVGDDAARELWGRPGAGGAKAHRFGHVIFPDCEEPNLLMALTRRALRECSSPRVSYEVEAARVAGAVPLGLGDDVLVADSTRTPAWRLSARVVRRVRELGGTAPARVTLGSVRPSVLRGAAEVAARVSAAEDAVAAVGDAADAGASRVAALEAATGATPGESLPELASKDYVREAIEALDDLSGRGF